jgi:hypothetical protein
VTLALQNNRQLRVDLEGIASAKADSRSRPAQPCSAPPSGATTSVSVTAFSLVQDLVQWLRRR